MARRAGPANTATELVRAARLNFLPRLLLHAPASLRALVGRTDPANTTTWLGALVEDIAWLRSLTGSAPIADRTELLRDSCERASNAEQRWRKSVARALAATRLARRNFVEAQLVKKEIIKGQLEDELNQTIQRIKELKVEGVFADSGLPEEKHATEIAAAIEQEIADFEAASDLLLTEATNGTGFV